MDCKEFFNELHDALNRVKGLRWHVMDVIAGDTDCSDQFPETTGVKHTLLETADELEKLAESLDAPAYQCPDCGDYGRPDRNERFRCSCGYCGHKSTTIRE